MAVPLPQAVPSLERISIELTNRCGKGCSFCYNASGRDGGTTWTVADLTAFCTDCADHRVAAVSFGGGEPLEFAGLFDVLAALRGRVFRSMTTNGLLLDAAAIARLRDAGIDKAHVSIHFPE